MDHGDGISIGVSTKVGLSKAIAYARSASDQQESDVLVQEQVEGQEYRFLVVEGKVVAVAGRRPPCVVGDGRSTVKQLIHEKNQDPQTDTRTYPNQILNKNKLSGLKNPSKFKKIIKIHKNPLKINKIH